MQAVISGQAGVALLLEDQRLRSLHASTAEIIQRREREIPYLLGDATDLQFLEDVEIPEISCQLEIATAQADALHLALILLDPELPQDVRCDAANELADLFALKGVRESVESVLFAHPLPSEADLPGALSCCSAQSVAVRDLLVSLERLQSEILEAFTAWERIPTPVFGEGKDRASALATAVKEGLFRDFVLYRAVHASNNLEFFITRFLVDANLKTRMRHGGKILLAWLAPLRDTESLPQASTGKEMNWSRFDRVEKEPATAAAPTSLSPASLAAEPQRTRTTIGRSIFIKGDLTGDEDLMIEGRVEGIVDMKQNNVTVGKSGKVKADVYGQVVTVEGEVDGNVFAQQQAILRQSGAIRGNIVAPRVVLENGSRFKGSIDMKANDSGRSQALGTQRQSQWSKEPEAASVKATSELTGYS